MRTLKPFDYYEATTVKEAVKILSMHGEKARVLAGGIDLIPRIREEKTKADFIVNIQNIPELDYINYSLNNGLRFGAMVKLHTLEMSKVIQQNYPILYEAIHQIASMQTKCMGTAVGNICVATPASDVVTALFALNAELLIAGTGGERTEPISKFYIDYGLTSLKLGEIVIGVFLPTPANGTGTAFFNLVRTHADIAKISVAVSLCVKKDVCAESMIAIGACAPTVFRATKAEAILKKQKINSERINKAAETAAGETHPINDLRSTADYRKEMAQVLVRRALEKALEKARA